MFLRRFGVLLGLSVFFVFSGPEAVFAGAYDQLLQMSGGSAPSVPEPTYIPVEESGSSDSSNNSGSWFFGQDNSWEAQERRRKAREERAKKREERRKRNKFRRDVRKYHDDDEDRVSKTPEYKRPGEEKEKKRWPKGLPQKRSTYRKTTNKSKLEPIESLKSIEQQTEAFTESGMRLRALSRTYENKKPGYNEKEDLKKLQKYNRDLWAKTVKSKDLKPEDRFKMALHLGEKNYNHTEQCFLLKNNEIETMARNNETFLNRDVFDPIADFHANMAQNLVEHTGEGLAEAIDPNTGGKIYGNLLGIGKVSVSLANKKYGKAAGQVLDIIVSRIRCPQAQFAVDGGRIYANTSFRALDNFMNKAMQATGNSFDGKKFWTDLKQQMNPGQKAIFNWVGGYGDE
jgi:hypothetical protein